jgi:hypothetical protein
MADVVGWDGMSDDDKVEALREAMLNNTFDDVVNAIQHAFTANGRKAIVSKLMNRKMVVAVMDGVRGNYEIIGVGQTVPEARKAVKAEYEDFVSRCPDMTPVSQFKARYGCSPEEYHGVSYYHIALGKAIAV